jgi:hypothetical protein
MWIVYKNGLKIRNRIKKDAHSVEIIKYDK